jgi:two-component system response regulator DegU
MSDKIRIIIADDHPIFRSGLKSILKDETNIQIVGEASDGNKALELISELNPDIAVLDMSMPEKTGLQVLRELKNNKSKVKVIFLTMYREEDMFDEAMNLEVDGYVLKESAENDIVECINQVAKNNYYISPVISNLFVKRRNKTAELDKQNPALLKLTLTERRVLKLVSQNKTSKEISEELFISPKTVDNHRTSISNKLNLHGTHSLVKFAIENRSLI